LTRNVHKTIERLLGSLETLAREESIHLENDAWAELTLVQDRASLLIAHLATLMEDTGARTNLPAELYRRAQALGLGQGQRIDRLQTRMVAIREELSVLNSAHSRVRRILPAYRGPRDPHDLARFSQSG